MNTTKMTSEMTGERLAPITLVCTEPGCTVHTVTHADRHDDYGQMVPNAEAVMVAHYREEIRTRSAQPFQLFAGRKTAKAARKPALKVVR